LRFTRSSSEDPHEKSDGMESVKEIDDLLLTLLAFEDWLNDNEDCEDLRE
jgi:hypothetical protein